MDDVRERRTRPRLDLGLAVLYALCIFVLGSLHSAPAVVQDISDKVQHALGFALLAWLWWRALLRLWPRWGTLGLAAAAFLVSVGLGGALELWQGLLGYRSCDLYDWFADAIGAGFGVGAPAALAAFRARRSAARAP